MRAAIEVQPCSTVPIQLVYTGNYHSTAEPGSGLVSTERQPAWSGGCVSLIKS